MFPQQANIRRRRLTIARFAPWFSSFYSPRTGESGSITLRGNSRNRALSEFTGAPTKYVPEDFPASIPHSSENPATNTVLRLVDRERETHDPSPARGQEDRDQP